MSKLTAIIDIGSNSIRLEILKRTSRFGFYKIYESKKRVRIGEGAYQNSGILQNESMERAFLALWGFSNIIQSFRVRKIFVIATSALRDAPNKSIFINRIKRELNLNIKIIDGKQEAYLGGLACANLLDLGENSATMLDIGGGSTEFALIQNKKVIQTLSLNLGTVRLKELFSPTNNFLGAEKYIDDILKDVPQEFFNNLIIGIGGTIRALSQVLTEKNSTYFYQDEQKELFKNIINFDDNRLLEIGFSQNRVDVIRWGVLIFRKILDLFNAKEIITTDISIRKGVFLKDILRNSNNQFPNNFNVSVRTILDRFPPNYPNQQYFTILINKLFTLTKDYLNLDEKYRKHLIYTSKLIGIDIENRDIFIDNNLIYQIKQEDVKLIVTLIQDYNNRILEEDEIVYKLKSLLYIVVTILSHFPKKLDIDLDFIDNKLIIKIPKNLNIQENLYNLPFEIIINKSEI